MGLSRISLVYTLSLFLLCVCIYCHGLSNQLSLCAEDMNIVDFVRRKKQRTDDLEAPALPAGPAVPRSATPIKVVTWMPPLHLKFPRQGLSRLHHRGQW